MLRVKIIQENGCYIRGYKSEQSTDLEDIYTRLTTLEEEVNLFLVDLPEENIVDISFDFNNNICVVRYKG